MSAWWWLGTLVVAWWLLRRRTMAPPAVQIVAHRGASGLAPENTLAALRRAQELGVEWAEVDVQRTADGVLVLVHDDTWERTTGFAGTVAGTPWETVRGLDAGTWFDRSFAGESPPRLEAALELARSGLRLNLEIKSPQHHPGIGPEIVAAVRRAGVEARVLFTCFDADLVELLASASPDLEFGYLAAAAPLRQHARVRTWSLHHALVERDPALLSTAHAAGVRVLVWTVDDRRLLRRLAALGVDGVITNHPERWVRRGGWRF